METGVLTPQVVLMEVDCNSNSLSAELEVRKLQELVRRLEEQNQQLRTRADPLPPPRLCAFRALLPGSLRTAECRSAVRPVDPPGGGLREGASEGEEDEEEEDEDSADLLDLGSLCPDESDETWLYVPSRSSLPDRSYMSPLQWSRHVLDRPKPEETRRTLACRLQQVARWRQSISSPASSPVPPLGRVSGVSPISASPPSEPYLTPQSERNASSLSSPHHLSLRGTLSPAGKDSTPLSDRSPMFLPHLACRSRSLRHSAFSSESSLDSEQSKAEGDSIALGYKLQDLTDVQVMARLQEESLRQDYACAVPGLAARRSQSLNFQLGAPWSAVPCLAEELDGKQGEEGYSLPPPPRLTRLPHSHTFSSARDWRQSVGSLSTLSTPPSTPSTPPSLSAGFVFQPLSHASPFTPEQQGFRPGSDKLRRSMPNLLRTPSMQSVPSMHSVPSMPSIPASAHHSASPLLLRSSQSFDSSIPPPGQLQNRVHSVGNFSSLSRQPPKATAYVSPTIKGSVAMTTSAPSLQSLSSSCKGWASGIPLFSKAGGRATPGSTPSTPRSSLPRPASFIATPPSSTSRSKLAKPERSLMTPPKSLSTLSALRDVSWRDGCY